MRALIIVILFFSLEVVAETQKCSFVIDRDGVIEKGAFTFKDKGKGEYKVSLSSNIFGNKNFRDAYFVDLEMGELARKICYQFENEFPYKFCRKIEKVSGISQGLVGGEFPIRILLFYDSGERVAERFMDTYGWLTPCLK